MVASSSCPSADYLAGHIPAEATDAAKRYAGGVLKALNDPNLDPRERRDLWRNVKRATRSRGGAASSGC